MNLVNYCIIIMYSVCSYDLGLIYFLKNIIVYNIFCLLMRKI